MASAMLYRDCWFLFVLAAAALVASVQAREEAIQLCVALRDREVDSPELYARLNASSHNLASRGVRMPCNDWDCRTYGTLFHCLAHRWLNTSAELLDFMLAGVGPDMAVSMLNDQSEGEGRTPVMVAAAHGLSEAVSVMVARGADWTLRGRNNRSLLCEAVKQDAPTVEVVLKLHAAAGSLDVALEEASCTLRQSTWAEGAEHEPMPVLLIAVSRDDVNVAALLLRAGASLTSSTAAQSRPLSLIQSHRMLTLLLQSGWDPAENLTADDVTSALSTAVKKRDPALGEDLLALAARSPRVSQAPAFLAGLARAMAPAAKASEWRWEEPLSVTLLTALIRSGGNATLTWQASQPTLLEAIGMRPDVCTVAHAAVAFSGDPDKARAVVASLEARAAEDDSTQTTVRAATAASRRVGVLCNVVDAYGRRLLSATAGGDCQDDTCRLRQVAVYRGIRTLDDGSVVPISAFPRDAVHELVCFAAAARNDALLSVLAHELGRDRAMWSEPCFGDASVPLYLALDLNEGTHWLFDSNANLQNNPRAVAILLNQTSAEDVAHVLALQPNHGTGVMHLAALNEDAETLRLLVQAGGDINQRAGKLPLGRGFSEATPLYFALLRRSQFNPTAATVTSMLQLGATLVADDTGTPLMAFKDCQTVFHHAALHHPWALRALREHAGEALTRRLLNWRTHLPTGASQSCFNSGAEDAMEHDLSGSKVSADDGLPVLHLALWRGWDRLGSSIMPSSIRSLLRAGADPMATVGLDGETAFHFLQRADQGAYFQTTIASDLLNALSNATTASGEALLTSEEQRVDPENDLAVFKAAQRVAEQICRERNPHAQCHPLAQRGSYDSDETDNDES